MNFILILNILITLLLIGAAAYVIRYVVLAAPFGDPIKSLLAWAVLAVAAIWALAVLFRAPPVVPLLS